MSHYIAYYDSQVGSGIDHVFVGSPYQRGNGIGSFLSGLFRKAVPLLTRGAKTVGKEALHAGLNILGDMTQSIPLKDSLKSRSKEVTSNLKRRADESLDKYMTGFGRKRLRTGKVTQRKRKRKSSKKKKKKVSKKKKVNKRKKTNKKKKGNKRSKKIKLRKVTDIFGPA